jgi:hypothetical protein
LLWKGVDDLRPFMNPSPRIEKEFEGLSLSDERLERRARGIVSRALSGPAQSFPELLPTSAELEGAYRFFQNEKVSASALMEPHVQSSLERARRERVVRIVHDTTGMSFGGVREGLGTLGQGGCGFWAHFALAVGGGEERAPLGIVGLETKVYPTLKEKEQRHKRLVRKFTREKLKTFPSVPVLWSCVDKWTPIPLRLRKPLKGVRAVHVMDREADNFAVFTTLKEHGIRFVIRGSSKRLTASSADENPVRVSDQLVECEVTLQRGVRLSARPKASESHPSRDEREARLSVRAARVTLRPAIGGKLTLNVVEVFEVNAPDGEEPVNWVLYTTEPIQTPEDVAGVVDHYRSRWRIEEYFKALKTGCSIEKRQLTSHDALQRALALFIPIAWHLLALRTAAHQKSSVPAVKLLTPVQLTVLRALALERQHKLPEEPSTYQALLAIAALGGHLRRNGDPGWLTLHRGYDRLRAAESIWILARTHPDTCDQS